MHVRLNPQKWSKKFSHLLCSSVWKGVKHSVSKSTSQSVRETGRQIGRRYSWLQSEPIPLAWLPDSRDRRKRWSQEAYQRSIHNGPHYSFKRRSHTSLSPSHQPVLETTLLFSSSVSVVLFSDTSSFSLILTIPSLHFSLSLSLSHLSFLEEARQM